MVAEFVSLKIVSIQRQSVCFFFQNYMSNFIKEIC